MSFNRNHKRNGRAVLTGPNEWSSTNVLLRQGRHQLGELTKSEKEAIEEFVSVSKIKKLLEYGQNGWAIDLSGLSSAKRNALIKTLGRLNLRISGKIFAKEKLETIMVFPNVY